MKISLIHPRTSGASVAPLGILYLAAYLRKYGHQIQVFDPAPQENDFVEKLMAFDPHVVGLSLLTTEYARGAEMIPLLKSKLPRAIFTAGGIHPTSLPELTLRDLGLKAVVVGEGELTMLDLCQSLEKGRPLREVPGICFEENGEIISTAKRSLVQDLDTLPFPGRDLLNFEWYLMPPGFIRGTYLKRSIMIMASRGCPYNCIFCSIKAIYGRIYRRRSVNNVLAEVDELRSRYRIDGLYFLDDTFTADRKWALDICRGLKPLKLVWGCNTRVNTVAEDLLMAMKDSGCEQIDYGVESGSDKVLNNLKKGITTNEIRRAFALTKKAGLRTMATIMIGNPGETKEDIEETIALLREISPHFVQVSFTTPFPGSELYHLARENSWVDKNVPFSEVWSHRSVTSLPVMSINFSPSELFQIRTRIQNLFWKENFKDYFLNLRLLGDVSKTLLKHPARIILGLKIFLRDRDITDFINYLKDTYRLYKKTELFKG